MGNILNWKLALLGTCTSNYSSDFNSRDERKSLTNHLLCDIRKVLENLAKSPTYPRLASIPTQHALPSVPVKPLLPPFP